MSNVAYSDHFHLTHPLPDSISRATVIDDQL